MTLYVEQADFHDVPDDSSLERHGDDADGTSAAAADGQGASDASSSFQSPGGESSTSARSLTETQNNCVHEASGNDPRSPRSMPAVAPLPGAPPSPLHVSVTANRRSSLPSSRSKSEEYLFSATLRDQLLHDSSSVDTERIIAENLESTRTITQLKLQLAEALSTLDNLQHSNQLLDQSLRCAKDEAYAHTAQHRKELSSLREELLKAEKDRDDLATELQHMREERDDARREVTRMTMLSIKQQQRRLSSDTTESALSLSSMGSHGVGGRRGSLLQNFCDSSRHLLGGSGGNAHTGVDVNSPVNRRASLTIADLQNSRRSIMLSQQGNSSNGRIQGRRGSATTNSASLALALANANASGTSKDTATSTLQPNYSSTANLQELRNTSSEQSRRSSGGTQWLRRLSNLGVASKGSNNDACFENSQESFSSILGLDKDLDKVEEQQANADGSSSRMLPGRGASPLTAPNAIPQDINANDEDDELSESDKEAIRNAAGVFGCDTSSQGSSISNEEGDLHNSQLIVDAVGWTSRLKLPEENTEEKTTDIAVDGTFALGEETVSRNSFTARNA